MSDDRIVSLGAIVALGFLSGKIQTLFSKTGNSINNVTLAACGSVPPPPSPPGNGTQVVIPPGGFFNTFTYLAPGQANGTSFNPPLPPSGKEGFYTLFTVSPPAPTSFTVNGWTFTCTWHNAGLLNAWVWNGNIYFSACYN